MTRSVHIHKFALDRLRETEADLKRRSAVFLAQCDLVAQALGFDPEHEEICVDLERGVVSLAERQETLGAAAD